MRARYLTQCEIDRLQAVSKSALWLPLRVAHSTGLRVGDVVKLGRWQFREGGLVYCAEKTGKWGFAPCSRALLRALWGNMSGPWVFPSPRGHGHISRQAVWARVKRACRLAGVDPVGVSPHSFRKFFAVDLLGKTDLETVREALQHSSTAVTELYAFSDWITGKNAELLVKRCDISMIIGQILPYLERIIDKKLAKWYDELRREPK